VAWVQTGGVGAASAPVSLSGMRGDHDGAATGLDCTTLLLGGCDRARVAAAGRQGPVDASGPGSRVRLASQLRVGGAVEHGEQVAAGGIRKAALPAGAALATRVWVSAKGRAGGHDAVVLRARVTGSLRTRRASVRGSGAGCMMQPCWQSWQKSTPPYWVTEIQLVDGQPLQRDPQQPGPQGESP